MDAIKANPNHLERSTIKSTTTLSNNNKKPILETEPEPEYEYYYEYIYEEGLCHQLFVYIFIDYTLQK